jgi:hypothetical protein
VYHDCNLNDAWLVTGEFIESKTKRRKEGNKKLEAVWAPLWHRKS